MYCPNCGANLADTLNFCTQCGTKLKKDQPAAAVQQKQPEEPRPMTSTGSSNSGGMRKLQCELCGSTDIMKQEGFFVCQHCGCKYSLEEARKMMIEGKVEINNEKEIRSKIELAKEAVKKTSYSEALVLADQALSLDSSIPDGWLIKAGCVKFKPDSDDLENYLRKAEENKSNSLGIFTHEDYDNLSISYIKVRWIGGMANGMGLNISLDSKEIQSCPVGKSVTFVCKNGLHAVTAELMNMPMASTTVEVNENETVYLEVKQGFTGYKINKTRAF